MITTEKAELIEQLEREVERLRETNARLQSEDVCDACIGHGPPDCMCGGTGKMSVAALYLRSELVAARAEVERLKADAT